ncbi:MAG: hypothetical protein WA948_00645 [Pontixanthobacter sp.]
MARELERFGMHLGTRIRFFDAYRLPDKGPFRSIGSNGNFNSQLEILRQAAAANESVLILEDDCEFLPAMAEFEVPEGTDILYGGHHARTPGNLTESGIVGSHCIGYSARAAKLAAAYLERLLDVDFPPDELAAKRKGFDPTIRPPIDGSLVWFRRAHPELKTVFKMLAGQRASRSDVTPQYFFDRIAGLHVVGSALRWLKKRLLK